jgi:hypothetical protein
VLEKQREREKETEDCFYFQTFKKTCPMVSAILSIIVATFKNESECFYLICHNFHICKLFALISFKAICTPLRFSSSNGMGMNYTPKPYLFTFPLQMSGNLFSLDSWVATFLP